jgi:glycine/D-amino acid oxidase-like deaminating enzyme
MSVSKERTVSLWMNTEVAPNARILRKDDTADVVVVGSGIAGLSTAYELSRRGKDVVVLDRGPIGMGMTSRTTAHLVAICDDSFDSFIKLRGVDAAKAYYESQSAAVDRIDQVQAEERIACNFRRLDGFLLSAVCDLCRKNSRYAGATDLTKVRSTQVHSGLWCPYLAQLRPEIVPWSTLCRAG